MQGIVRDAFGPVPNARVRWQGEAKFFRTDAQGRFRIPQSARAKASLTAWKEGYLIAGARFPAALTLQRLPADDNEDYEWIDPAPSAAGTGQCGNCHPAIYQEWSASGHARAARNRHFRSFYDGSDWHGQPNAGWSLLGEHPDGAGVCTACHAPSTALSDPAYFDLRGLRGVAAQGVHCDYCHKIVDASTERLGLTHGRFGLTLLRPQDGQLFFGPLEDVDRGEDSFAPVYRESRYCASCHEGTVFGVPVYTTYSEWLASPARKEGKQCQTCHMAPTGSMTNAAPGKGGIPRDPWSLASHSLLGGQAAPLQRSLHVAVQLERGSASIRAVVTITCDQVGHRVPTGFIDRNIILVVEPRDGAGRRLAANAGPQLPPLAGREWAGLPGRLYAKQLVGFDGHSPMPFWTTPGKIIDTRLDPGQASVSEFRFPPDTADARVRVLYHRFWPEVAQNKHFPDNEIVVVDRVVPASMH